MYGGKKRFSVSETRPSSFFGCCRFDGITHKLKWANNIRDTGPPPTGYAAAVDQLHPDLDPDDSCPVPDSLDLADPVDSPGSASPDK